MEREGLDMEKVTICQSCGMPMSAPEEFGTEADGSANLEYCCYCFAKGELQEKDMTLEEMIEACAPFAVESGEVANLDEARATLREYLPTLKRWAKS